MKTKILIIVVILGGVFFSCGRPPSIAATATQPEIALSSTPWPTYPPPMPATYFLGFCQSIPPFDRVEVRRAFGLAIDRYELMYELELIDAFAREFASAEPATSFVPPDIWPDKQSRFGQVGLNFDPEMAVQILADLRFSDVGDLVDTPYQLAVTSGMQPVAESLRKKWNENLGVSVSLAPVEAQAYLETLDQCQYPLFLLGWYADYDSPYNFLHDFVIDSSRRLTVKWKYNDTLTLADEALNEPDPTRQLELYIQAEKTLTEEEVVIVPLFHYYHTP